MVSILDLMDCRVKTLPGRDRAVAINMFQSLI